MDILNADSSKMSGTYTIDPDGIDGTPPFDVKCKMIGTNGWTLVGLEKQNNTENLKMLGIENGTPADLLSSNNAIIGIRFRGLYDAVRIEWDGARYLEFNVGTTEIFDDTTNLALPINSVNTSEGNLKQWVTNGAKFCRAASKSQNKLPGDTSWAIKPIADVNTMCGCNSMGWAGQGAFYGGTQNACNQCNCYGGGFAGVKDNGEAKGIKVNWETRIYVR